MITAAISTVEAELGIIILLLVLGGFGVRPRV